MVLHLGEEEIEIKKIEKGYVKHSRYGLGLLDGDTAGIVCSLSDGMRIVVF